MFALETIKKINETKERQSFLKQRVVQKQKIDKTKK